MSDHWKSLANQFGIPGPADPPETEKPAERTALPDASSAASAGVQVPPSYMPPQAASAGQPATQPVESRPVESRLARARSSMWGDDSDAEVPVIAADKPAGKAAPPQAQQSPPRSEQPPRRQPDPLEAIVSVEREPTVPGFEIPEDQSPGAVKVPVRRSAWDALIGTLGIKTSSEAAVQKAAKPVAPPEKPVLEQREPGFRDGRGRDRDAGGQRRERPEGDRPSESPAVRQPAFSRDDAVELSGFGAGLIDTDRPVGTTAGAELRPESEEDRPRGRGRRGGSRRRGRGGDRDIETAPTADAEIDWEIDSVEDDLDAEPAPARAADSPSPRDSVAPADDEESEFRGRPRRSRRRGQRQTLSVEDVESGRTGAVAGSPRTPPARDDDSVADRPRRRDESAGRDRGLRPERSEPTRGEGSRGEPVRSETGRRDSVRGDASRGDSGRPDRGPRPPRSRADEPATRSAPRAEARRPESARGDDDFIEFDDEDADGFGSGLNAEVKPVAGEDDEPRTRPRRRRGRRGRGGAVREDRVEVEGSAELIDASDEVVELPAFDDDLEDDDEAERLRRRSRSGRSRAGRREPGDRETETDDREPESVPRGSDFVADPKTRVVPTWLDTISLLVDSNIQRRSSGGGGGGSRNQGNQGRGGRR